MDKNVLPKGHIIGWAPPPSASKPGAAPGSGSAALSKNAKKRAKQREKKAETAVKDNWEDDDEAQEQGEAKTATSDTGTGNRGTHTPNKPNWAAASSTNNKDTSADGLATELEKLDVR